MKLTTTDREILNSYKSLVEGLADYLGPCYELVLHSLEDLDNSVIAITNGHYTGRKIGSPVTDLALKMLTSIEKDGAQDYISYHTTNKEGLPLKSCTIAIRGENKRVIGLLCMNLHLHASIDTFMNSIVAVNTGKEENSPITEEFSEDVDALISSALLAARKQVMDDSSISSTNRNKEIISLLYQKGIFNLKDSVSKTAGLLGISKNTVYLHLRRLQK